MTNRLITAPTVEPVTLADAKAHLYVMHDYDDLMIGNMIVAAREDAEHRLGRLLITQTWELSLDSFPSVITMPFPVASVVSITYTDTNGVDQVLAPASYQVDTASRPGRVAPAYGYAWPATRNQFNAVRVRYTAGFGLAADVPYGIKSWILLRVGSLFENRESAVAGQPIQQAPRDFFEGLLDRHRVYS